MTSGDLIAALGLEPHPLEGGYFRRTYESGLDLGSGADSRKLLTSIYYLLTRDSPIGYLHSNRSDIIHYYHMGASVSYVLISPQGEVSEPMLGSEVQTGEQLQLIVPGGYWKASTITGGDFALISEAVSPGFDYSDNQLATRALLKTQFPQLGDRFDRYCRPE